MITLVPAIDLRNGHCVRLLKGDFNRQTSYSDEPLSIAADFTTQGAQRLHIVDLDGAKQGRPVQNKLIAHLADKVDIPVQTGGGIRSLDDIEFYAQSNIAQVVLGTSAIKSAEIMEAAVDIFENGFIAVALDIRDGSVATEGWLGDSGISASEIIKYLSRLAIGKFIITDISRDGTLQGPNIQMIKDLAGETDIPMTLSGGVGSLEDLQKIAAAKIPQLTEIITGKALYEKRFTVTDAMSVLNGNERI